MILLLLFVKGWHPENQILGPNCSTECPKDLFKTHPKGVKTSIKRQKKKQRHEITNLLHNFRQISRSGLEDGFYEVLLRKLCSGHCATQI